MIEQKINIKNARRLETEIDVEIVDLSQRLAYFWGNEEFETRTAAEDAGDSYLEKLLMTIEDLQRLRFDIREAIGKFNKENNIDIHTLGIAKLTKKLEVLNLIYESNSSSEKTKTLGGGSYKSIFTLGTSLELKEKARIECKRVNREIQRLKDKCTGINSSGTITLTTDQVSMAKKMGLMD